MVAHSDGRRVPCSKSQIIESLLEAAERPRGRSAPVVEVSQSQVVLSCRRGRIGYGDPNHRGWNTAFDTVYDYRLGVMQYATAQVTYNTDCCGLSVQYRRFNFGVRNETQFLASFSIANIGSFGTLRKQERLF